MFCLWVLESSFIGTKGSHFCSTQDFWTKKNLPQNSSDWFVVQLNILCGGITPFCSSSHFNDFTHWQTKRPWIHFLAGEATSYDNPIAFPKPQGSWKKWFVYWALKKPFSCWGSNMAWQPNCISQTLRFSWKRCFIKLERNL